MSWSGLIAAYEDLSRACDRQAPLDEAWAGYVRAASEASSIPHIASLRRLAEQAGGGRAPGEVSILEHGCASGKTTMMLWSWGFTKAHGIDIIEASLKFNRVAREVLGLDDRFHVYSGTQLPFSDRQFDFVFSQQVIEHVSEEAIDAFYREEGRILRAGGLAFHQVPHRFTPVDTHTNTWLIHYFPRPFRRVLYRAAGHDPDYVEKLLQLRSPMFHRRMAGRHIGETRDLTMERLFAGFDEKAYKGPKGLRRLLDRALAAPGLRSLLAPVLRNLVMMDTLSIRRP